MKTPRTMGLWLLVESGLHREARLRLEAGRTVIGGSDDDDVLLTDEGVQPAHLVFVLDGEGLHVEVAGAGVDRPGSDRSLEVGDTLQYPNRMLHHPGQSLSVGGVTLRFQLDDPARGDHPFSRAVVGAGATWQSRMRVARPAVAAAIIGVVAVSYWQGRRPDPLPVAPEASASEISAQFAATPAWQRLQLTSAADGRSELRGLLDDRRQLQQVLRLPALARQEPVVKVVIREEVLQHVRQVLQDPGLELQMHDPASSADLPSLEVRGTTSRPGAPALLTLLKKEWQGRVEIVDATAYEPGAKGQQTTRVSLPIKVTAVNAGQQYVEAASGARFFVGSVVGPEQVIESIGSDRVVFQVNGQRVEFVLP